MNRFSFRIQIIAAFVACCLGVLSLQVRAERRFVESVPNLSLISIAGHLNRDVARSEIRRWSQELRAAHLTLRQKAQRHLWLGEIELARNSEPDAALRHFEQVLGLVSIHDPIYGTALYDRAITLFRQGAYRQATAAFHDLLLPGNHYAGFSRGSCALWYRHASACAGYHAQRIRLGITEPPRLDPLCGVASLAAAFRAQGKPYDRKTLLAHCRMTGLGNNMADLLHCARNLGMSAWTVRADATALKALPKPLVAYVEFDHFIAVTRADEAGVSYLCSDCGAWPGGRRDLTWKQWRAMDCSLYLAVVKPGSPEERELQQLQSAPHAGLQAAQSGTHAHLAAYQNLQSVVRPALRSLALARHLMLYILPPPAPCGDPDPGPNCPPEQNCSCDGSGAGGGGGSSAGDPVDLATGQEEYHPEADLTVYNPIGPSVVWQRRYGTLRGPYAVPGGQFPYQQFAFGNNWTNDYDMQIVVANGTATLNLPNGGAYLFNVPSTPTAATPQVTCTPVAAGQPMLCSYNYNSDGSLAFVITWIDRSQWTFSSRNGYALSRMTDNNGNYINFLYTTPGKQPGYELATITDSNKRALLTIRHNANFNIVSVTDRYGRSVYYQVKRYANANVPSQWRQFSDELVEVSQIVGPGGAQVFRYRYGYMLNTNNDNIEMLPILSLISVPSATGKGISSTTLHYSGVFISSITDGNGNTRTYLPVDANTTQVMVTDSNNHPVTSYTVAFDAQMRTLYRTDGSNSTATYTASYTADNLYQPAQVTNGNGQVTTTTYDKFGQPLSVTSPRNVTTIFTRDYSAFPLGELTKVQQGSKAPISLTYYEPSDLVKTETMAAPGTVGSAQMVTTKYTYDALGNLLTLTRPGNETTSTITLTANYTRDGSYTQAPAIQEPITVTDNLGHTAHLRYDSQGNLIAHRDAVGIERDYAYNIANQQTRIFSPVIGDVTNLLRITRSVLVYSAVSKTYSGTLTLTNVGSRSLQGGLLLAFTNVGPSVTLANASGSYIQSPTLFQTPVNLAPGGTTSVNVGFSAPSAAAVTYGVQVYLTDSRGNPSLLPSEIRSVFLYPGGPLISFNTYDETGVLFRQVGYRYGKEGELLAMSGSVEPVTYTYDAAYRRQTLADGNGHTTRYAYNEAGYLASLTYPTGESIQYPLYDAMGHILKRIDGRGIETDYAYNDPESSLTAIQYVNSASYPNVSQYNASMSYDGYGRLQDVFDPSGTRHFGYDDLDQQIEMDTTYIDVKGHSLPTVRLYYTFNPDGSRQTMSAQTTTANYNFHYGYDAAGRQQSLTNPLNETTQWNYLDNGLPQSRLAANGVLCQYAFNRHGFLNDLTYYAPNGALMADFGAMVYDVSGNRISQSQTMPSAPGAYSGVTRYSYDGKNQLVGEQSMLLGGYGEGFAYDGAGNPLQFRGTSHSYNQSNQFTDTGFSYDGSGNPTGYSGTTLTFDPENHLTAYGPTLTMGYRADGLRAWKAGASGTTYFIYDGLQPVLELDGSGNVAAVNTVSDRELLSRNAGGNSTYYVVDPLGGVVQRLTSGGTPQSFSAYDAFGVAKNTSPPTDPFGYRAARGYLTDAETGIFLLGHRYYDPIGGRFITRDPSGYQGGVNLYSYSRNAPIYYYDNTGRGIHADCVENCAVARHAVTGLCFLFAVASVAAFEYNRFYGVVGGGATLACFAATYLAYAYCVHDCPRDPPTPPTPPTPPCKGN